MRFHAIASIVGLMVFAGCGSTTPSTNMVVAQLPPHAVELVDGADLSPSGEGEIASYEQCVAAGNMTTRSMPPRCITVDGQSFVRGQNHELSAGGSGTPRIGSFDECVAAGNTIRRTLPATCMDESGQLFTDGIEGMRYPEPKSLDGTEPGRSSMSGCADLCGDGSCQEIVCMALGCPCPETPESCPSDCAN